MTARTVDAWTASLADLMDDASGVAPAAVADRIEAALALPVDENPLLALWEACTGGGDHNSVDRMLAGIESGRPRDDRMALSSVGLMFRRYACVTYAWAVPSPAAVARIAAVAAGRGVVEVGAGAGYWAATLARAGVDVVATDSAPADDNWFVANDTPAYYPVVVEDGRLTAARHPGRVLLIVWPGYGHGWAAEAVRAYHAAGGRTVVYVGEGRSGCCGDDELHELLGDRYDDDPTAVPLLFAPVYAIPVPQWDGIHDYLTVHERVKELGCG